MRRDLLTFLNRFRFFTHLLAMSFLALSNLGWAQDSTPPQKNQQTTRLTKLTTTGVAASLIGTNVLREITPDVKAYQQARALNIQTQLQFTVAEKKQIIRELELAKASKQLELNRAKVARDHSRKFRLEEELTSLNARIAKAQKLPVIRGNVHSAELRELRRLALETKGASKLTLINHLKSPRVSLSVLATVILGTYGVYEAYQLYRDHQSLKESNETEKQQPFANRSSERSLTTRVKTKETTSRSGN